MRNLKHGNEFATKELVKITYNEERENASIRRVTRLLFFVIGFIAGVLIMTF